MEDFQFYMQYPINSSVQEGDNIYFISVPTNTTGGFYTNNSTPIYLGPIKKLEYYDTNSSNSYDTVRITVSITSGAQTPNEPAGSNQGDFILFSKDRSVNISSVKGYFSEINIVNDSKEPAELFTVGCDISQSS